jgi:predicted nucleic acid-binding protein
VAAYFLDSSALVKRYARETGTAWMLSLFRHGASHALYAARITRVETTAALVRKRLGSHLTPDAAAKALQRLRRDFRRRFYVVEVTPALLHYAEALAEKHGLRGYDAVQLAAAIEANTERARVNLLPLVLVAADNALLAAGTAEGLATDNPNIH